MRGQRVIANNYSGVCLNLLDVSYVQVEVCSLPRITNDHSARKVINPSHKLKVIYCHMISSLHEKLIVLPKSYLVTHTMTFYSLLQVLC